MANERQPFGRVLGLRTLDWPRSATATPTREAPPPIDDNAIREAEELLKQHVRTNPEIILDKPKKKRKVLLIGGSIVGAGIAVVAGVWGINKALSDDSSLPIPQTSSADFPQSFTDTRLEELPIKETVFDDSGIEGKITKNNAVQMTPQEYEALDIPLIESNGSVNLPFSIVAKDGTIRDVKIRRGAGGFIGGYRIIDGNRIPINDTLIYEVPDLQAGDRFKSQIDGIIHGGSSDEKNPDGSVVSGQYIMEGVDKKGNKVNLTIVTVGHRTLIDIPNDKDYTIFVSKMMKLADGSGRRALVEGWTTDPNMPKHKVGIGVDLWEFTTTGHHKDFKGQVHIRAGTGVKQDGKYSGGGARINIPTANGKAIVLK